MNVETNAIKNQHDLIKFIFSWVVSLYLLSLLQQIVCVVLTTVKLHFFHSYNASTIRNHNLDFCDRFDKLQLLIHTC